MVLTWFQGIFVPFFYVAQFAQDITGASEARTFDVLAAMNAGSVLGRPIPGIIADVLGRYNLMTPCTLMAGLLCLTVWLTAKSYTSLMCFSVFYGFFSGAIMSLTPSCVAQISQREQIGMRVGLAYAIMSFPCVVSLKTEPFVY
jgi:predicted MFS family arabinose efflux permease